ncbi:hypothetical protein QBC43DRAFT_316592 [Cladorrhinum sp. PSN259]|nr:hypothetical protein QBC43DRAFT_316592 [Cladorrhinum sp. PSN259]
MSNMNKNWNDRADKDLFFTILSVKNIGVISGQEWTTIGNHMRSIGYGFTNEGCRQHFQGLRRAQNKADAHQPATADNSQKKADPTLNPITRRPGPGRGRPRKNPVAGAPSDGAAAGGPGVPPGAVSSQPGPGPNIPSVPGAPGMTGPPPPGVAVSPVPVPVIPGAPPVAPQMIHGQGVSIGQGGVPQPQMMSQGQGQMRPQAIPVPQGQQTYHVNQQGQPRPMAVAQMQQGQGGQQPHPGPPRPVGMVPQAQMDGPNDMSALAVDPSLEAGQGGVVDDDNDGEEDDDDDDMNGQVAKRPRLGDGGVGVGNHGQDDPSNQLGDEEQALISSLAGHNGAGEEYGQDYRQYDV